MLFSWRAISNRSTEKGIWTIVVLSFLMAVVSVKEYCYLSPIIRRVLLATEPLMQQKRSTTATTTKPLFKAAAAMLLRREWSHDRLPRKCWFNKSMDALEKFWQPSNPYPVILQKEEPWDKADIVAIQEKWPGLDIQFADVSHAFFQPQLPSNRSMDDGWTRPSDVSYKRMCIYKSNGFLHTPAIADLDYVMMLDDDSCFAEPVPFDVFAEMRRTKTFYAYKQFMVEFPGYVVGLEKLVDRFIQKHFNNNHTNSMANPDLRPYLKLRRSSDADGTGYDPSAANWPRRHPDFDQRFMFRVFATNLEWIDVQRYRQKDIQTFFHEILDETAGGNMIFHRRWGDAPLRTELAHLFWNASQIMHVCSISYQHSFLPLVFAKSCSLNDTGYNHIIQDAILQTLQKGCRGKFCG